MLPITRTLLTLKFIKRDRKQNQGGYNNLNRFMPLTLQQLQTGATSSAHVANFVLRVPLGAARSSVAPT